MVWSVLRLTWSKNSAGAVRQNSAPGRWVIDCTQIHTLFGLVTGVNEIEKVLPVGEKLRESMIRTSFGFRYCGALSAGSGDALNRTCAKTAGE
jgi:hypothetical protein